MAVQSPEAKKHLEWCLERALAEYESGGSEAAFASMLSDIGKHPIMEGSVNFLTMMILQEGANKGPEGIRKALMGFNI